MKIITTITHTEQKEIEISLPCFRKSDNSLYKFYETPPDGLGRPIAYDTITAHIGGHYTYAQGYTHSPELINKKESTIEEYATALQAFLNSAEKDLESLYNDQPITKI